MSTLTFADLRNESGLKFTDISTEEYRTYYFPSSTSMFGEQLRISNPIALNTSKSGGHRVLDGAGVSHYIPKGWTRLEWKAKEGQAHFVK